MTATNERTPWNTPRPRTEAPRPNRGKVLTSWKEIASYMGKGVRTVQRWERDFNLPVRRPASASHKRAIIALVSDLDTWIALNCVRMQQNPPADFCAPVADCHPLRSQIQAAVALRTANRMLLSEIHVAVAALRSTLSEMRPVPSSSAVACDDSFASSS